MKTACITGLSGMDGSIMAKLLLRKGYKVYGLVRRTSNPDWRFINELGLEKVEVIQADLTDSASINSVVQRIKPDEFYNFAAMSHVGTSFTEPVHTGDVTGLGVVRILEAIRQFSPKTKFYQASTSELFGNSPAPQNEHTILSPNSPYAAAKLYAHNMVRIYRESYKIFASSSILCNHECHRRSKDFVTRKITSWIGENFEAICSNRDYTPLQIGNIEAKRDWGFAPDYCYAVWQIMQQDKPDDYVIGTGVTHTVRQFLEAAFKVVDIEIEWKTLKHITGDILEIGLNKKNGLLLVAENPKFYRPLEVNHLQGDATKATNTLGWKPFTPFETWIKSMIDYDMGIITNKYIDDSWDHYEGKTNNDNSSAKANFQEAISSG